VLTLVYIALAIVGCGYVLFASFLGHLDGGPSDSGPDAADAGEQAYGIEHGGHGSVTAGNGAGASFTVPFFSPLALATFFGALGGFGLIAKYGTGVGDAVSLAIAGPAALLIAYAVTYGAWRVMRSSTGSSQIRSQDLAGAAGEVVTPIPAGGLGEVTAMVGGQRFTAPARESGGGALPRGTMVTVEHFSGSTLIVTPRQAEGVKAQR
jgi:membrane protein implicated in regulation of membrane protease activity